MRKRELGYTISELTLVMFIFSLVIGGVWIAADTVWSNYRFKKVMEQIFTVTQNMRDYYGTRGRLPSVITPDGNDVKIIPIEMREDKTVENGPLRHALGGRFQVLRSANYAFQLRLSGLSREACIKLLMTFPFGMQALGTIGIENAFHAVSFDPTNLASLANNNIPMDAVTAAGWCSGTSNEVGLDFKLLN